MYTEERRITTLLKDYWHSCQQTSDYPMEMHLPNDSMPELQTAWDSCFIINISEIVSGISNYNYDYLGETIIEATSKQLFNGYDDRNTIASLQASRLHDQVTRVMELNQPIITEDEFTNSQGQVIKFRQCLTPFYDKNNRITYIFGGLRYRMV